MNFIYFISQDIGDIDNLLAGFLNGILPIVDKSLYRLGLKRVAELLTLFFCGRTGMFIDQVDRRDAGSTADCEQI